MNQIHESVRWLYEDQGTPPHLIARKMHLQTPSVHAILRKLGFETHSIRQAKSVGQPRAFVIAPDRTPCTYCGIRGDIGCKHQVAA